jgi:hypothetical protein
MIPYADRRGEDNVLPMGMGEISFESARTTEGDPVAAADALVAALSGGQPRLVTVFAGDARDHAALNRALRARLPPETRLIGASTGGEIDRDGMHRDTVVLGALSGDFRVGLGIGERLTGDAIAAGSRAMLGACEDLGVVPADLDRRRHIGLVIDDGFRLKKEELLMGMLTDNPEVTLVGGGASAYEFAAGSDRVRVHVDGQVSTDAVLLAMFETEAPFAAMRTHWFHPSGEKLVLTKVDPSCTRAVEIDGRPAAARYAELIGVSIDDLAYGRLIGFESRPTAVKMGREYVLRSPWMVEPDGSILFANLVEEGMELELMSLGDPVEMTRRFFTDEIPARVGAPSAALLFHCGARSWYARTAAITGPLSETFRSAPPCAGMDVCFEIYNGLHVNTTLTALVFGGAAGGGRP